MYTHAESASSFSDTTIENPESTSFALLRACWVLTAFGISESPFALAGCYVIHISKTNEVHGQQEQHAKYESMPQAEYNPC